MAEVDPFLTLQLDFESPCFKLLDIQRRHNKEFCDSGMFQKALASEKLLDVDRAKINKLTFAVIHLTFPEIPGGPYEQLNMRIITPHMRECGIVGRTMPMVPIARCTPGFESIEEYHNDFNEEEAETAICMANELRHNIWIGRLVNLNKHLSDFN